MATHPLVKHVIQSFNKANTFKTKITREIAALDGMSGLKTRILYNEICSLPDTVYLEVGSWKGSTMCAAGFNNPDTKLYCIENWSMWGGPKDIFENTMKRFNLNPTVFEEDFTHFDPSKIPEKITVYLYDGDHTYSAQRLAITKMWDSLADEAIIMIDDWNNEMEIKQATLDGLNEVGAEIIEKFEVQYAVEPTHPWYHPDWCIITENGQKAVHTPNPVAHHEFWNGIGVFVVRKSNSTVDV